MKKITYKIHKWAGVTLGVILFLLAISGVGITFRGELLPRFYPDLFQIPAGKSYASLPVLYESALKHVGDKGSITNIYSSHEKDEAWIILYRSPKDLFPTMLTIDPFDGEIVGEMSMIKNFFAIMLFMHANLFLGKIGSYLVGLMGLILVFFILSGIYIWLPHRDVGSRFKKTLSFNSFKSSQKTHHLLGIVFTLPLLISAITGFLTVFDLSYYLMRAVRNEPHRVEEMERKSLCTIEEQQNVLKSLPANTPEKLISVHFCTNKNGLMKVSSGLIDQDFLEGYERVVIDPKNLETLQTFNSAKDPSSWNIKRLFMFPVHTGEYFGTFGKAVNLLTGLGLMIIFISGCKLFYQRRKRSL